MSEKKIAVEIYFEVSDEGVCLIGDEVKGVDLQVNFTGAFNSSLPEVQLAVVMAMIKVGAEKGDMLFAYKRPPARRLKREL